MDMVNQVKMGEEFWYALTEIADSYGYKSRNELVVMVLQEAVKNQDEKYLKNGVSKMRFLESSKAVADVGPKKLATIMIPKLNGRGSVWRKYRLYFRDGRIEDQEADNKFNALKMIEMMDEKVTQEVYDRYVERHEEII